MMVEGMSERGGGHLFYFTSLDLLFIEIKKGEDGSHGYKTIRNSIGRGWRSHDIKYDQLQDIENLEDLLGDYLQEQLKKE